MEQEWGAGWVEGVHPDDVDRCMETYTAAFGQREPFSMEYRLRRHDGTYRWILDLGRPFDTESGDFGGYLGACYDVNNRREMIERLQDAQTTTTLFLQTLYHDLRAPLASMSTAVSTLDDQRLGDEPRRELHRMLDRNLERARSIVDQVQLLEQSQSGTLSPRRTAVEVGELLHAIVARLDVGEHPVKIVDRLGRTAIDPVIIDRAVENLLNNAIVHTPPGTPIQLRAEATNGDLRFAVIDEGPGIEQSVLDSALDPRPTSGSPTSGGFGLGLSLAHRYATAHQGRLDIRARPGRGTEIAVVVPQAHSDDGS
jgi:signal transduction histidine kinase